MRLSSYPFVIVRIGCNLCNRSGQYRLARLAAKFGPEMDMRDVLYRLAFDCPWREGPDRRTGNQYVPKCRAGLVDLDGAPKPPDLPPAMMRLRLVKGGTGDALNGRGRHA